MNGNLVVRWLRAGAVLLTIVVFTPAGIAQEKPPELPKPQSFTLTTDDAVDLHLEYFPSGEKDRKQVAPILLIHGWESRGSELEFLAKMLQAEGHAVFVPDLRGHGESSVRKLPNVPAATLKPGTLKAADFVLMATKDFLTIKTKILELHNRGEFNVQWLTLIGVEFGAIQAVNWAALDWSQPVLPSITLGHDVKALVLVSPISQYKTATFRPAINLPAVKGLISVLLLAGVKDGPSNTEFRRYDNIFKAGHKEPKADPGESEKDFAERQLRQKTYYEQPENTVLQGTKLINATELNVARKIANFIRIRINDRAKDKDLPAWEGERRTKEPLPGA